MNMTNKEFAIGTGIVLTALGAGAMIGFIEGNYFAFNHPIKNYTINTQEREHPKISNTIMFKKQGNSINDTLFMNCNGINYRLSFDSTGSPTIQKYLGK
jgi:hypothetical protein